MKIVRENIEFERGEEPKKAMRVGQSRKKKKGDHIRIWVHEFGEMKDAIVVEDEDEGGIVTAELSQGGHWVDAIKKDGTWEGYL